MKEMVEHMKNKADIDDVNNSLDKLYDEFEKKVPLDLFNQTMDNQNYINTIRKTNHRK